MREDTEDGIEETEDLELDDAPEHELADDETILDEDDLEDDLDFEEDAAGIDGGVDGDEDEDEDGGVDEGDEVVAAGAEGEVATVEEEDEDLEDEDDIEASLDVILKERLVVSDDGDDDDEEDVPDAEDRAEGMLRVLPKQPGEFVCQSCFLVKHQGQLADPVRMLCRDCV